MTSGRIFSRMERALPSRRVPGWYTGMGKYSRHLVAAHQRPQGQNGKIRRSHKNCFHRFLRKLLFDIYHFHGTVEEEDAVQMVDLMAEGARLEPLPFYGELFAAAVVRFHLHPHRDSRAQ